MPQNASPRRLEACRTIHVIETTADLSRHCPLTRPGSHSGEEKKKKIKKAWAFLPHAGPFTRLTGSRMAPPQLAQPYLAWHGSRHFLVLDSLLCPLSRETCLSRLCIGFCASISPLKYCSPFGKQLSIAKRWTLPASAEGSRPRLPNLLLSRPGRRRSILQSR